MKSHAVARFEHVSAQQFALDWENAFPKSHAPDVHRIPLPVRATVGSAGYDLYSPCDFVLLPGEQILIPTGIRVQIVEGWLLALFPRSGLGFKYRFQLDNSVGIIDSDYYRAKNEGHILLRMTNDTREGKTLSVRVGEGIAQGIFLPYGITVDDQATGVRIGGFGSTTQRQEN